jgi:hypothetical protein
MKTRRISNQNRHMGNSFPKWMIHVSLKLSPNHCFRDLSSRNFHIYDVFQQLQFVEESLPIWITMAVTSNFNFKNTVLSHHTQDRSSLTCKWLLAANKQITKKATTTFRKRFLIFWAGGSYSTVLHCTCTTAVEVAVDRNYDHKEH